MRVYLGIQDRSRSGPCHDFHTGASALAGVNPVMTFWAFKDAVYAAEANGELTFCVYPWQERLAQAVIVQCDLPVLVPNRNRPVPEVGDVLLAIKMLDWPYGSVQPASAAEIRTLPSPLTLMYWMSVVSRVAPVATSQHGIGQIVSACLTLSRRDD